MADVADRFRSDGRQPGHDPDHYGRFRIARHRTEATDVDGLGSHRIESLSPGPHRVGSSSRLCDPAAAEAAVISDGLWQRLYGADPAILGKQIRLDTDPHTIVGVMPLGFRHPGRTIENAVEVWITPGLASQHPEEYPAKARWSARLTALQDDLTGNVRTTLLVVFGAVVCVLLICSVSIANPVVAKAA